jgi:gliding motility-associated-like protein
MLLTRALFVVISFVVFSMNAYSQDYSNRGKDFWISYPEHIDGTNSSMGIYVTSDVTANVTITVGTTILPVFTVTANTVIRKFIGPNATGDAPNTTVHLGGIQDGISTSKGIHVVSDQPIVVFSHIIRSARSGATLVLPTPVWGKEYIVPSYGSVGTSASYGEINVMASLPNTQIEITPSKVSRNGARAAGVPYTITLANPGDVYQLQFQSTADMSGTKVKSISSSSSGCNPIAVFSATTWSAFPCSGSSGGDNLYQQIFPVASWGKKFLTGPLKRVATSNTDNNVDYIRVFVNNPATVVSKTENGVTTQLTGLVSPGNYYQYTTSLPTYLDADNPVQVVQYISSQTCGSPATNSDPEMVVLSPVEQTINHVTVFSAHQNFVPSGQSAVTTHYLNVIMKTNNASQFRINGIAPTAIFTPITGTAYSYLKEDLTARAATNPVFTLNADSGFSAIAYGFGNVESYGYNAGTNVKDLYQYISVLNPNATVNIPATCVGTNFNLAVTFPYQPTSIEWQFGAALNAQGIANVIQNNPSYTATTVVNGQTLYVYQLPSNYILTTPGTYSVKILAANPTADGCGGQQELNKDFTVYARPAANFSAPTSCVDAPVQFADATTNNVRPITVNYWNFGDNTTSNTYNPTHTFNPSGVYNVSHAIINDIGCVSDTVTHPVTINPLPTATVAGNITTCLNAPMPSVTFTGAGGTAPYTFTYNINGGANQQVTTTSGNSVSVSAPTSTLGTFNYNLVSVSDGAVTHCTQAQIGIATVLVNTFPNATISGTTTVCQNASEPQITFTGTDGNTPYTFTYNINGGATLSVSTNAGNNTVTVNVPTTTPGVFTYNLLSVVDASNTACGQNLSGASATVTVNQLPAANITGGTNVCLNANSPQITFTGTGGIAPYTFSYNINGGPIQQVTTTAGNSISVNVPTTIAGTFSYNLISVTESSSLACSQAQTGTQVFVIYPLPLAQYVTNSPVCQTGLINFTDQSTSASGTVTGWLWNFDDPTSGAANTSTLQNPSHIFSLAGTYNITLTTTNSNGCVSTNSVNSLVVYPKPRAGFIIPEVCLSDTYAQFTDTSRVGSPSAIQTWAWNFGDPVSGANNTSNLQHPPHSYSATGNYQVQLIVNTNHGCKDTISQQLVVNGSYPVANYQLNNPTHLCANDSISITDRSTVFPGNITKIQIFWDDINNPSVSVIDDLPVFGRVYKHLYPNFQTPLTKTYRVRFRAFSGGVCSDDTTFNVTINAAPLVSFTPIPPICLDAASYLITQASEVGGVPGSGSYFGPGTATTGLFTPSIAGAGTHTIKYVYTSTAGSCQDSATQTIRVWQAALANFSVSTTPICEKRDIIFTDNSTSTEGTISQWRWDFGDGSPVVTVTNNNPITHNYPAYGNYTVKLTVVTNNGCVSIPKTIPVFVNPLPSVNFSFPAIACLPNANVVFTNLSTIADGTESQFQYLWNFGDPGSGPVNISTGMNPSHSYAALGPYNVKLQVTSGIGCINDSTIILNTIHPQPIASFTTDNTDVCIGGDITFTSTSDPADGTPISWNWNMGDNTIKTVPSFTYRYANVGQYDVSLYIYNSLNCKSTVFTKTVSINPYPVVNAGVDTLMLEGGQIRLTPLGFYSYPVTFQWMPISYLDTPTKYNPIARPPDDIYYELTVTSDKGCSASDSVFIKVLKAPIIPNIFSPNGDGVHDTWIIPYMDSYPGCVIEVFNRYGQVIYRSVGYGKAWDGKVKGKDVPVGTYYYVIDPKNGRNKVAGYVDIIRFFYFFF